MVIYDLVCADGHRFEGWFGQAADFGSQQADGLLSCPHCGSTEISKLPTASRIRTKRHSSPKESPEEAALAQLQRLVVEQFEDVGDRFPEEARRIHYGEAEARDIRGTATANEAQELLEEGVSVLPFRTDPRKLN
jgi:hypothetical protein